RPECYICSLAVFPSVFQPLSFPMPAPPKKLRKQYSNADYPEVVLRFEDGHEIRIPKGVTKSFDAWEGERIKILAIWDHTSGEREKVDTLRAEAFPDAQG
ncbi:MAG TPA: hypothetical protein VNL96_01845, partial [Gemmatimonadaceae bacterium]|nr:hypothetical protein [Gemmatimonadaceae bacterium]